MLPTVEEATRLASNVGPNGGPVVRITGPVHVFPDSVQLATSQRGLPGFALSYTYQARKTELNCCVIAMPQPDSAGPAHHMSVKSVGGGVVPVASGWRVIVTFRVVDPMVPIIVALFAFANVTFTLP